MVDLVSSWCIGCAIRQPVARVDILGFELKEQNEIRKVKLLNTHRLQAFAEGRFY